jgi:hypothetical protein
MAYWKLIEKIQIPHVTKAAWEDQLNVDKNEWKYVFNIPLVIRDAKIRTFQYKLIMNLIPCNQYLFRIKRHDTNICNYCPAVDNMTHYFYMNVLTQNNFGWVFKIGGTKCKMMTLL